MLVSLIFGGVFIVILAAISYVDFREMRIPDVLSLSLLLFGVIFWISSDSGALLWQLGLAVGVALLFWGVRRAGIGVTGRVGLGFGDVKMAGAGAVWIQPDLFPLFLFAASFSGLMFAVLRSWFFGADLRNERMPFAPFLAFGLLLAWVTGEALK